MKIEEIFAVLLLVGSFRNSLQSEDGLDAPYTEPPSSKTVPEDCSEIQQKGYVSGNYQVQPLLAENSINVYCDFDSYGGKWTVIQQRTGDNEAFDVDFETYKNGFDMNDGNMWVGLTALHELTKNKNYELLIELTDRNNVVTTANYKVFRVGADYDGYDLHVGKYTGTAENILAAHNLKQFTSSDSSQSDIGGGCVAFKGGWWGDTCKNSNLNGINLLGGSLIKATKMMIRPLIAMDPSETCATKLQMSGLSDRVTQLQICSCNENREQLKKLSELTSTLNNNNFVYLENRFEDMEVTIDSLNLNETILENRKRINDVENNIISTLSGELDKRFRKIEGTSSSNNKDVSKRLNDLNVVVTELVEKPVDERINQLEKSVDKDLKDIENKLDTIKTESQVKLEDLQNRLTTVLTAISELDLKDLKPRLSGLTDANNQRNKEFATRFDDINKSIKQLDDKDTVRKHGERLEEIETNISKIIAAELDKRFGQMNAVVKGNDENLNRKVDGIQSNLARIVTEELDERFRDAEIVNVKKDYKLNQKLNEVTEIVYRLDVKTTNKKIEEMEKLIQKLVRENTKLVERIDSLTKEQTTLAPTPPPTPAPTPPPTPEDCSQLNTCESTLALIQPKGVKKLLPVYCHKNKWTTIQRRINGTVDFYRNFSEYQNGFGSVYGEYWLGLENIYQMTKTGKYELYVDITDFDNTKKFAKYSSFSISSAADGYRLKTSGYSGDAGDSLKISNDMKFSARDRDLDKSTINCAVRCNGAWWYNRCHHSNLNGKFYSTGPLSEENSSSGLVWSTWKGYKYSFKASHMMIRRKDVLSRNCGQ